MELEKSIEKYIESKGFVWEWSVIFPNKETDFLGIIMSDNQNKIIYLHGWHVGKWPLEDKRYLIALLMAHYEIYGKDQREYVFEISSIKEIANLDKEVVELANDIVDNRIILSRGQ